ncbi:hypothetical protein B0H11DRAFT_2155548 [Mycena galericulata]|nr:hypothetical protein B0H11DRAFT_2155548 [Mycena galericulata]
MALRLALFFAALILTTSAGRSTARKVVTPVVASSTSYPSVDQGNRNRDSCTTTLWFNDVVLWTCRDTQLIFPNNTILVPEIPNTASYSGFPSDPKHPKTLVLDTPVPFGPVFYPLQADECPPAGLCDDGSRWVGWPNTGPVVSFNDGLGQVVAYGFMVRQQLSGLTVLATPGTQLYRVVSKTANLDTLPTATIAVSEFWSENQVGYGSATTVVRDGIAYLYGATPDNKLAVARVPVIAVEDKLLYEYYVNGEWTPKAPALNDSTIALPNTSAKQGTTYYSPKWESYVWIGGDAFPDANFYISTAPEPEGPWSAPLEFYTGSVGTGALPAYSALAHPAMTDGTGDYVYLTWTKTSINEQDVTVYDTPLVRVDWA